MNICKINTDMPRNKVRERSTLSRIHEHRMYIMLRVYQRNSALVSLHLTMQNGIASQVDKETRLYRQAAVRLLREGRKEEMFSVQLFHLLFQGVSEEGLALFSPTALQTIEAMLGGACGR
jgi:hypothetical protein